MALTSNVAYGFIMPKNPTSKTLPDEYKTFVALSGLVTVSKGVKLPDYESADFVEVLELVLFGSYPKLDIGFPIKDTNEDMENIVLYVKETHQSAEGTAQSIDIKFPSVEAADQVNALAAIFGKEAGWVIYIT